MSDALALAPGPTLEQYEKLAQDFQSVCQSGDSGEVRKWAAGWMETIARLQGVEITPQLRKEIAAKARRIAERWHKISKSDEGMRHCSLADAQLFIAQEHSFASWPKFAEHLTGLTRVHSPMSHFEAAADAIVNGDVAGLKKLLDEDPALVQARSTREHRSTLLHYVSANGVEDFRQRTPDNIIMITKLLLDTGADVDAKSDAYGGGCTALGLVATSVHPERAGVQIALIETLLDHGARIDQPSPAGNRHSMIKACLANGQPKAAAFFASLGTPVDLEAAAALGMLNNVQSYFGEDGTPHVHAERRQIESAFIDACGYGRRNIVEFLLERGVDVGARKPDGRTGLHTAAYGAHADIMRLLLEHGCPVDAKENNFDATPLDVALWVWNNSRETARGERCYEVIALLAQAGAILDPQQWDDIDNDGRGMLEKVRSDPRILASLRGEAPN